LTKPDSSGDSLTKPDSSGDFLTKPHPQRLSHAVATIAKQLQVIPFFTALKTNGTGF
jgi:hypothetical protein